MDAAHHLDEGWRAANLKADIDADFALRAFGDLERFAGLRDVDANGFFAVSMFAAGDRRFEMLDVEEGRRGDLDGVDVLLKRCSLKYC